MNGQAQACTRNHRQVTEAELPDVGREEGPHLNSQGVACILDVSQNRCHDHDHQTDPKEREEAAEISMVTVGVEM
jgi:hypothetical protein